MLLHQPKEKVVLGESDPHVSSIEEDEMMQCEYTYSFFLFFYLHISQLVTGDFRISF